MKKSQILSCALLISACGGPEELEQDSSSLSRTADVRYGDWRRVYSSSALGRLAHDIGFNSGSIWIMSQQASAYGFLRVVSASEPLVPSDTVRYGDEIAIGAASWPPPFVGYLGAPVPSGSYDPDGLVIRHHGVPNTVWRIVHPTAAERAPLTPGRYTGQTVQCNSPFALVSVNQKHLALVPSAPAGLSTATPRYDRAGRISKRQTWHFGCSLGPDYP